jgi:hypothetical protein
VLRADHHAVLDLVVAHSGRQIQSRYPERGTSFDDTHRSQGTAELVAKFCLVSVKRNHFVREEAMHIVIARVVIVERSISLSSRVVRIYIADFRVALRMQTIEQSL